MRDLAVSSKIDRGKLTSAYLLLFLTAFGWGLSTVLGKMMIGSITPTHILMVRAWVAALVIFCASPGKVLAVKKGDLTAGLLLGLILFFSYYLGIASLKYTTASKAGFLMALSLLFVPSAETLLKRRLPSRWIVFSVFLSLLGLRLISGINGGSFNYGDLLAVGSAGLYALYTIVMDRIGKNKDDYLLSFILLLVLAVAATCGAVGFEGFNYTGIKENIYPLLLMGVVGTGLATLFQTKAQKTASSESVGIILLAEPLFTLIFAAIFLHETIYFSGLMGGILILLSLVVAVVKKV
ncbi:MAG: DMT family transporter [Desulfitobacteriaceae bacterium]|nr:DMT family transporter [Desulfitobacteriaceae bacterium]MDD4753332.1 DMT family transporter [Desulfitobacteriaceae bacterium]